jgi:signal transduction histidine kinase
MRTPRRLAETSRSGVIAALLLSSIVLAGVLTWQAQASLRDQREAAEKVVRDYAALVADEFARRAVNELGYSGFYPVISAVRQQGEKGSLPAPAELRQGHDESLRQAADLVRATFRYDPAGHRLEWSGTAPDATTRAWMVGRLQAASATAPVDRHFVTAHGVVAGKLSTIVFVPTELRAGALLLGFEAADAAFVPRFRTALDHGPLFPQSLLHGALDNGVLFLRVSDPSGREVFRAGARREPYLGTVRPFGADYNGILDGFVLHAAVDPAAAPALVIGGLPRSRLPLLLALLTVTAGLSVTAVLQVRREQALSSLRSDFVSRVSHELRTPLTQIRMFTETLLLDRVRSTAERQRCLEIIDRESRRLTNLVENVLRFSRTERGENHVEVRARDIVPLVDLFVRDFEPLLGSGSRLTVSLPERAIAEVDESALRQILLNLLDNAVKYGPPRQQIRLEVSVETHAVLLAVEDQGPGIPPAERELVWQRFYRLPRHRESAIAGTGIGLAVVRELVELLGGRVLVENGRGQGARFVITLRGGAGEAAPA